mmetsp:Transcript_7344/g.26241  ORF Transcript_7344/g.26241 Transcript_7344/m.26241 type:complete len:614 (-) Transcript_7344:457-2298(-)
MEFIDAGYPPEIFLSAPDEELECPLCMMTLRDPISCPEGHTICRGCGMRCRRSACPTCAVELSMRTATKARPLKNIIDKMPVRCPHSADARAARAASEGAPPPAKRRHVASRRDEQLRGGCAGPRVDGHGHGHGGASASPGADADEDDTGCATGDSGDDAAAGAGAGAGGAGGAPADAAHDPGRSCGDGVDGDGRAGRRRVGDACGWTGRIADLGDHLDGECAFAPVHCPFAGCRFHAASAKRAPLARRDLASHEAACTYREGACGACGSVVKTAALAHHRTSTCAMRPVPCPRACGAVVPYRDLPSHRSQLCPLQLVACPLAGIGCAARLERRLLAAHAVDAAVTHMTMSAAAFSSMCVALARTSARLEASSAALATRTAALEVSEARRRERDRELFVWRFEYDAAADKQVELDSGPFGRAGVTWHLRLHLTPDGVGGYRVGVFLLPYRKKATAPAVRVRLSIVGEDNATCLAPHDFTASRAEWESISYGWGFNLAPSDLPFRVPVAGARGRASLRVGAIVEPLPSEAAVPIVAASPPAMSRAEDAASVGAWALSGLAGGVAADPSQFQAVVAIAAPVGDASPAAAAAAALPPPLMRRPRALSGSGAAGRVV